MQRPAVHIPAFVLIALLCLGARECRIDDDDANVGEEEDVVFETLEQGNYSGIFGKRLMVIRDINDFTQVWNDHAENVFPQPAVPDVDFGTDMVIAAFMGEQPSGGYSIEIEEVRENEAFVVVEVEMETPGDNCAVTPEESQPFHMVLVPDTQLPVQFIETTVEASAC